MLDGVLVDHQEPLELDQILRLLYLEVYVDRLLGEAELILLYKLKLLSVLETHPH